MVNVGKCPKCEQVIARAQLEPIDVGTLMSTRQMKGVSYLCPHCKTVLSVSIDPLAVRTEIVAQILEELKKR